MTQSLNFLHPFPGFQYLSFIWGVVLIHPLHILLQQNYESTWRLQWNNMRMVNPQNKIQI